MNGRASHWLCVLAAGVALAIALIPAVNLAAAQAPKQSPLFKGTTQGKAEPIKIQAASLEVRDKDKVATFSGDVIVIQGDTELRCNALVVYYEGELGKSAPKAPTGQRNQQIRRMEAKGNVVVIQKDQRATGDRGDFDMRNNTVTLTGNVVVTRGEDVLRGQRLTVNLTTGVTNVESGGSRVEGLFKSNQGLKQQNPGERPRRTK